MKKKIYFFFLLCFLINFKFSFSYFELPRVINKTLENDSANWDDEETVKFSKTLDMGQCTCNLTSHCDYRCCCDLDCSEEIRNNWTEKNICKNIGKNRMESFQCIKNKKNKKHKEEEFNYNKKKAGITVKDHISNIMCIYYDRSGDMGNFYLNEVNEESLKENRNNWIKKFFYIKENGNSRRLQEQDKLKYGEIINDFSLYKSNSNGYCIPTKISFLIPFESSCNFSKTFTEEDIVYLKDVRKITNTYGTNDNISEITYIIEYNNSKITNKTINILKTNQNDSKTIKFKVLWKKANVNINKKVPSGYFQGTPIKIAFKNKDNKFVYYEKGFFIAMNDKNQRLNCAIDLNNVKNPNPILFKNNIMYSCKTNSNQTTYIEERFCNKELRLAKSPDKPIEEASGSSNDWIKLYLPCSQRESNDTDFNINLLILTSKDGKEHSPYEHIEYAKLDSTTKKGGNGIITLTIKFVELSYSSLMNSREGKITSLIPLPEEILKSLTNK